MRIRRIGTLIRKEAIYGSRSFFFVFAIVTPVAVSLILTLLFGSVFSDKPKLGIIDEGQSTFTSLAMATEAISATEYDSIARLRDAVEAGRIDMGVVLPTDFDEPISNGQAVEITAYIWGESLAQNRVILGTTIASLVRDIAGVEAPIEIIATTVGDSENIPWNDRMLPLVVLMAVVIGGAIVPASSLVDEKQHRTLSALVMTPTTLSDVFLAKGLMGVALSVLMGILILVLNRAFSQDQLLLVTLLALGAIFSAELGIVLGAMAKDITTLFTIVKAAGIFLYAPALIYIFPGVPEWIGYLLPTYYIVAPVIEVTQRGADWTDVLPFIAVLVLLIAVSWIAVVVLLRKARQSEMIVSTA